MLSDGKIGGTHVRKAQAAPSEAQLNEIVHLNAELVVLPIEDLQRLVSRADRRAVPELLRSLEQIAQAWENKDTVSTQQPGETFEKFYARSTAGLNAIMLHQWVIVMIAQVPRQCFIPCLERIVAVVPEPNTLDVLAMCRLAEPQSDEPKIPAQTPARPVADIPSSKSLADPNVLNNTAEAVRLASNAPVQQLLQALVVAREVGHKAIQIVHRECLRRREADIIAGADVFLRDSDPRRRVAVAMALTKEQHGERPDPKAMALLNRFAADPDGDVVCAALPAIAAQTSRRYDRSTLALMRRCEGHPSEAVRLQVLYMLQSQFVGDEIFQPAFLDICVRLSNDVAAEIRQNACRVLSCYANEIGDREDVRDALFQRVGDTDGVTKHFALSTLVDTKDPRATRAIEEELIALDALLPSLPQDEARELIGHLAGPIETLADPLFLPYLKRWKPYADDGEHGDEWLHDLIRACSRPRWGKLFGR